MVYMYITILPNTIFSFTEDFPDQLAGIIKYQRKVEPWLVKTDFPNSWPIRNTGKKETARLMEKGDETDLNVMTYGAYRSGGKNHYKKWTKAMLSKCSGLYLSQSKHAYMHKIFNYSLR